MTLDHILSAIEDEAASKIAEIEKESLLEATAILDKARDQVRHVEAEAACAQDAELRADVARTLNRAQVEATTHVMRSREAVFQRALDEAKTLLANLSSREQYPSILRALSAEALSAMPGGFLSGPADGVVVRVSPRDADLLRSLLASEQLSDSHLSIEPVLDTWGGVVVADARGRIVIDNTLERRLRRAEPHLRRLVAEAIPAMSRVYEDARW